MGWCALVVILSLFCFDCLRYGWQRSINSTFWLFTIFFTLSYPIKYILISYGFDYQAPTKPEDFSLIMALIISTAFWLLIFFLKGSPHVISYKYYSSSINMNAKKESWCLLVKILFLTLVCVSGFFLIDLYISLGSLSRAFVGNSHNEVRVGNGPYFIFFSLYLHIYFVAFLSRYRLGFVYGSVIFILVIILGFLELVLLCSRSSLYLIVYAVLIRWFIIRPSKINSTLMFIYPVFVVLLVPFGHVLRKDYQIILTDPVDFISRGFSDFFVNIGSTFEGVEYLARFLDVASIEQLVLGVDKGVSWIFNFGLSLIPRVIWESKPYLYGNVAQQAFLFPEMYETVYGQTTLPPGFIVDSIFGFGFIGIIIFSVIYAKIFRYVDKILFSCFSGYRYDILIASTIYCQMFNLVRGGTAMIMLIILLVVISMPFYLLNQLRIGTKQHRRLVFSWF